MSEERRKPTLKKVAEVSGTSPAAVSLVLNGRWQQQRIKPDTAQRILKAADDLSYSANLQARGLSLSRSGLGGMIMPHYRNRFFAGLAETFEAEARSRGLCPVVVSTQRDPQNELRATEALLAQQVEFLFIAGVHRPEPLNALCASAGKPCINVDLPGGGAPSVISDNKSGARRLTKLLVDKLKARGKRLDDWFFFGGVHDDFSTQARIAGFRAVLKRSGVTLADDVFDCTGYAPSVAEAALRRRYRELGRLPAALCVNGVTGLEGAIRLASSLPAHEVADIVVGAFDWDPFAEHLPFDLTMVEQDVERLISASFEALETFRQGDNKLVLIPTRIADPARHERAGAA